MAIYTSNPFSVTVQTAPEVALITEDTLLQVYPKSVWLRKVIVGTPRQETITLTNPSAASIALTSYVNSNSEYDITGLSQSEVIGPGATKTFTIDYDPFAGGGVVQTGSLTLNCNNGQTHVIQIWSSKFDSAITPTAVSAAGTLSTDNATYVLQNDLDESGTVFSIAGDHVSLDLNGHTIKYGSGGASGVHGVTVTSKGLGFHVYNGTIEQSGYATASSAGTSNHPVNITNQNGAQEVEVSNLTINVDGNNARAVEQYQSPRSIWVHDNTINSKVDTITSRHSFDGVMINVHQTNATRMPRVNGNVVSGSMQGAIYCAYQSGHTNQIYNNTITMNSVFVNDFAIICGEGSDTFGNTIDSSAGSSRGIRPHRNCHIYDNTVTVRSQAQYPEYSGCQLSGTYAIQFENESGYYIYGTRTYNNTFTAYADECGASALRITGDVGIPSSDNKIFRNVFKSLWQSGATKRAQTGNQVDAPFAVSLASEGSGIGYEITNNEFEYAAGFMWVGYSGFEDLRITNSVIEVSADPSTSPVLVFKRMTTGKPNYGGHEFIDNTLTGNNYSDATFEETGSIDWINGWTLTVVVTSDGSTPISGATVVIDDADALEVSNQTTPANGTVTAELTENAYSGVSSLTTDAKTPHDLTITAGGYTTRTPSITMNATKTVTINMTTGAVT